METKNIWYIDTTLRDGEQAPGVSFNLAEKITTAALLDVCGVHELEVGTPAMGSEEINCINAIVKQGFAFRTSAWVRALKSDIDAAQKSGVDGVNISFPLSEIHIESMGKTRAWVLDTLKEMVFYAQDHFSYVSVGAQDASRAEEGFLNDFVDIAYSLNIHRLRIADTVGCLNPFSTLNLISSIIHEYDDLNIEFHGHNDLGMATANTIAAMAAGAQSVSTTINGLGERAGNASLDEVVFAARKTLGYKDSLNSRFFPYIASYIEKISGRRNSDSKPVTGRCVTQHESGVHTRALINNSKSYQLLDSEEIGKEKPEIVFGKHSGCTAIIHFFSEKGISLDNNILNGIVSQIKLFASLKKEAIREEELLDMYYRMS